MKIPNRPTPEGIEVGKVFLKLAEPVIEESVANGTPDERCKSCAFRVGTVPNGSPVTIMDAIKCVMEQVPFYCHQTDRAGLLCHGYKVLTEKNQADGIGTIHVPWDFSDEWEQD